MADLLLLTLAGGVGAVLRATLDQAFATVNRKFPVGILLVNVLGSAMLGVIVGWGRAGILDEGWQLVLGVGLCGGFTTFSTAAVDGARLLYARRWVAATSQWLAGFAVCLGAGWLGFLAARG